MEYEMNQLVAFSKQHSECFELLQVKLDHLCRFITSEENEEQWRLWGNDEDIIECSNKLRDISALALSHMEKYQSIRVLEKNEAIGTYLAILSNTIREELEQFQIDGTSKVLFVGSGALPLTALTIAKETKADVMCQDIDNEAVYLGSRVAEVYGLHNQVHFSRNHLKNLSFLQEATHIIIASLVGNKIEVLEELKQVIQTDTHVILRYGNGLKSLFNYPLEKDLSQDWELTPLALNKSIYDTVILNSKKCMSEV